jgi:PncC family amidohydrolase
MEKEYELVKKLTNNGYTISTAESCTGGLLSAAIVNVSGASEVFDCGFVTYANDAKEKIVKVRPETLNKYGAVSAQTAAEMASGCAAQAKADLGLSTTGIAGPDGGTEETPVGLVYVGCSLHGTIKTSRFLFSGNREEVRRQTVDAALDLAIHCIDKEKICETDRQDIVSDGVFTDSADGM